jgi:hypothetical protein
MNSMDLQPVCIKEFLTAEAIKDIKETWSTNLLPRQEKLLLTICALKDEAGAHGISILIFEFIQDEQRARLYLTQDIRRGSTQKWIFINEEGDMFTKEKIVLSPQLYFLGHFGL